MTSIITIFLSMASISIAQIVFKFVAYVSRKSTRTTRTIHARGEPTFVLDPRAPRIQTIKSILSFFKPQSIFLLTRALKFSDFLRGWIGSLLFATQEVECASKRKNGNRRSLQLQANAPGICFHLPHNEVATAASTAANTSAPTRFLNTHCPPAPPNTPCESNPSENGSPTPYTDYFDNMPSADTLQTLPALRTSLGANCSAAQDRSSLWSIKALPVDDRLAPFDRRDSFMSTLILHEKIGGGPHGYIYRGSACGGNLFAIKIKGRGKAARQNPLLREEVDAMEQASHSAWAAGLSYWQCSEDHLLISMPFFSGGNLYDYAKSRKVIKDSLSVFWTAEILVGLHSLHTLGIIHRDIKPENIMLTSGGHIRIIDFGFARLFNHDAVPKGKYSLFHSLKKVGGDLFPQIWALPSNPHTTNESLGTPGFSPPEVWLGKHYSYGVDYFAMGCILYELLTDNLPYAFDSRSGGYDVLDISVDPKHLLTNDQRDFLHKVLMPNPMLRPSVAHMKKHSLFQNIDWEALSQHEVPPPGVYWGQP